MPVATICATTFSQFLRNKIALIISYTPSAGQQRTLQDLGFVKWNVAQQIGSMTLALSWWMYDVI